MSISLSNSTDLIVNSLRIIKGNKIEDISTLFLSKEEALTGIVGLAPSTLNTIELIANSINNDPAFFSSIDTKINAKANTVEVSNLLNLKRNVLDSYNKIEIDNFNSKKANILDVNNNLQSVIAVLTEEINNQITLKASTDSTYSKEYIDLQLNSKGNKTEFENSLNLRRLILDSYSKAETDIFINKKLNILDFNNNITSILSVTNEDIATKLLLKADKITVDLKLDEKASVIGVFETLKNYDSRFDADNKIDAKLLLKLNIGDGYSKTYLDTQLNAKANTIETDNKLNLKSDILTTYNKTETDNLVSKKINITDSNNNLSSIITITTTDFNNKLSLKADALTTYTKTYLDTQLNAKSNTVETDNKLNLKLDIVNSYNKTELDTLINKKINITDSNNNLTAIIAVTNTDLNDKINLKANISSIYTQTQLNTKFNLKQDSIIAKSPIILENNLLTGNLEVKLDTQNLISIRTQTFEVINNAILNTASINVLNVENTGGLQIRNITNNLDFLKIFNNGLVYVNNDVIIKGNLSVQGTTTAVADNPYWIAANINVASNVFSNKGQYNITSVVKSSTDTAYTITFPTHPDGTRYVVLLSSSEFHTLYRNQTATSLTVYLRSSGNNSTLEGNIGFNLVILK